MFAVAVEGLGDDGDDGEEHAHQAVLEDAGPDDVEPGEAGARFAEGTAVFATGAFLQEEDAPEPVDGGEGAEEFLLLVQPRRHVLAHEGEEAGDGEGFVAVSRDLKVDCMLVVEVAQKRHRRVYWDHKQDADDVFLLAGDEVVGCMLEDEVEGYEYRD